MYSVQNSFAQPKNLIEPVAFVGLAFLASRMVQYFPEATTKGLLLDAALATATTTLYNASLHNREHTCLRALMGKVVALGFAKVVTHFVASSMAERGFSTSLTNMAKMGIIQVAISGAAAYTTTLSETEREYLDFSVNPRKWKRLSDEDQQEKAKTFIKADLPPFHSVCREDKQLNSIFSELNSADDWERLSLREFQWALTLVEPKGLSEDQLWGLIEKCLKSEGFFTFEALKTTFQFVQNNPERSKLFVDYVKNLSFLPHALSMIGPDGIKELFYSLTLSEPNLRISAQDYLEMSTIECIGFFAYCFEKKCWDKVPVEVRTLIIKRTAAYSGIDNKEEIESVTKGIKIDWIAEENLSVEEVENLKKNEVQVYHAVMSNDKEGIKRALSEEQLAAFNKRFAHQRLNEI